MDVINNYSIFSKNFHYRKQKAFPPTNNAYLTFISDETSAEVPICNAAEKNTDTVFPNFNSAIPNVKLFPIDVTIACVNSAVVCDYDSFIELHKQSIKHNVNHHMITHGPRVKPLV